jgi:hypothetical protein
MEVKGMEIENDGIVVLDEGVEESLEYATTCCKTNQTALKPGP